MSLTAICSFLLGFYFYYTMTLITDLVIVFSAFTFFPTLFVLALYKEIIHSPYLRGWELYSTSLKKHCLLKLFEVLLYGTVIYSFIYISMDIYSPILLNGI